MNPATPQAQAETPPGVPSKTRDTTHKMLWGTRPYWILLVDVLIALVALWAAIHLRFLDGEPGDTKALHSYFLNSRFWALGLVLMLARAAANLYFSLHRWSFKFSSLRDGARVVLAVVSGSVIFVVLGFFGLRSFGYDVPARGIVVFESMLTLVGMAGFRFMPRLAWLYRADLWGRRKGIRTLIVGAGASGEMLLRNLQRDPALDYHAVGFVDDDRTKWGHIVGGKPVLGAIEDLPKIAKSLKVRQVVIAIPRLASSRLRQILSSSFSDPVSFKILPMSFGSLEGRDLTETLRDISTEDLMPRAELVFQYEEALPGMDLDPDRCLLVAGAAGSIGSEVTLQLLRLGARRLVMVDTDENGLYILRRRFEGLFPQSELMAEVGDIREQGRMEVLFARHRPQDVFHAAARKHVPLMEAAPGEAIKTNVSGTLNLAQAAKDFGVERFVFMSTDKAVRPSSVMGASKRLGELVLQALAEDSSTRFSVVRFGNVLDSAGSVVPLFREQIARGGPVTVTHPEMQRYFMTISEAVGLVLRAAYGDYGRLCVLEMGEPLKIVDLAKQMITMAGLVPDVDVPIRFTGLRPGEKLFEELLGEHETVVRTIDKKIRVVEGPSVDPELLSEVRKLQNAAAAEDEAAVWVLLQQILPEFRSLRRVKSLENTDLSGSIAV